MRSMSFAAIMLLMLLSPAVQAQQSGGNTGDAIGHPPPLPGPPPLSDPAPTTQAKPAAPAPVASTPKANEPAPKGYTGAYSPSATPPTPYYNGPLPLATGGPGLNVTDSDGVSTRTVKAVPCTASARETDGFTTCVGIPDQTAAKTTGRRRR
jgi:hypothetical protein